MTKGRFQWHSTGAPYEGSSHQASQREEMERETRIHSPKADGGRKKRYVRAQPSGSSARSRIPDRRCNMGEDEWEVGRGKEV